MVKKHLKRLAMPKTWQIKRKGIKFVTRPLPGKHKMGMGLPVNNIFRDVLKYVKTTKELKAVLNNKNVLIDKKKCKEVKTLVGLMDVIEITDINEYYRIMLNRRGKIVLVPIKKDESEIKPCKIINITKIKGGKIQLNLGDGRNILTKDAKYKTNDTIVIAIPNQEIKDHVKFEKGIYVYLTGGKHIGEIGRLENIQENMIKIRADNNVIIETAKRYAFAIGKDKPIIKTE